jgi:hypothetical protein
MSDVKAASKSLRLQRTGRLGCDAYVSLKNSDQIVSQSDVHIRHESP